MFCPSVRQLFYGCSKVLMTNHGMIFFKPAGDPSSATLVPDLANQVWPFKSALLKTPRPGKRSWLKKNKKALRHKVPCTGSAQYSGWVSQGVLNLGKLTDTLPEKLSGAERKKWFFTAEKSEEPRSIRSNESHFYFAVLRMLSATCNGSMLL